MTYISKFTGQQINGAVANIVQDVILPPYLFAVEGEEFRINLSNLTNKVNADTNWLLSGVGAHMSGQLLDATPDTTDSGATITCAQYSLNGELIGTATAEYVVTPANRQGNLSVLVVGDSTIAGNGVVDEIESLVTADADFDVTWIGTQGTTNLHEGRSGWTITKFYSDPESPFYDVSGFAAGYSAYCDTNGTPDVVIIKLGINDFWSYQQDIDITPKIATALSELQELIVGILAKNANTLIGIDLIGGPSGQDNVGGDYGLHASWRIRRNFQMWNRVLIASNLGDNVSILHGNLGINIANYTNGLHPNATGYAEIGAVYYAWLKHVASLLLAPQYSGWHDSYYSAATLPTSQTFGTQDGDIVTQTFKSGGFHGIGLLYATATKGQYRLRGRIQVLDDALTQLSFGVFLWDSGTAVSYDIPVDDQGTLTNFLGNLNYYNLNLPGLGDWLTFDTTIDLGAAPDFTHLSLHISGYYSAAGAGPYVAIDLTNTSIDLV